MQKFCQNFDVAREVLNVNITMPDLIIHTLFRKADMDSRNVTTLNSHLIAPDYGIIS